MERTSQDSTYWEMLNIRKTLIGEMKGVISTRGQLERFYNLANQIIADQSINENLDYSQIDRWMLSRLQKRINRGNRGYGKYPNTPGIAECFLPSL